MNPFMTDNDYNDHHQMSNIADVDEFIGNNSDDPFSSSSSYPNFNLFDLTTTLTALFYGKSYKFDTG